MPAGASFGDVIRMLEACAPGDTIRLATHSRVVKYNGKVFPSLPKRENLEMGYIRKLIRTLGIDPACAKKHIPGLQTTR